MPRREPLPGTAGSGARQVLAWTFDTWGRVQVRLTEDGADGLRAERTVTIPLADVPGGVAAFERLRSLIDPKLADGAAARSGKPE